MREGGAGGGRLVATGTPEAVAEHPDSHTGRYLAQALRQSASRSGRDRKAAAVGADQA